LKLKIQRRWIEDLTEQTQMMARIVKELEDEATCRVRMLEDKLRQTSKCAYEVSLLMIIFFRLLAFPAPPFLASSEILCPVKMQCRETFKFPAGDEKVSEL